MPVKDTNAAVLQENKGFAAPLPPQSQSIKAQAQYQRESMVDVLGPVGDTLQQSLGVQKSQLDILRQIVGIMSAKVTDAAKAAKSDTGSLFPKTPTAVKTAPVPMSR